MSNDQIISICQRAEHNFAGTKCGIMDQYAVINGTYNHFLLLNCQTISHELVPGNLLNHTIILLNTNISHNLSSSEYNIRTQECQSALKTIQTKYPDYKFLCDIPIDIIAEVNRTLNLLDFIDEKASEIFQRKVLKKIESLLDRFTWQI